MMSNFEGATLAGATLTSAKLTEANFEDAQLTDVRLNAAILEGTNLAHADLSGSVLAGVLFLRTNMKQAKLSECNVYGVAVWDVDLENAIQSNLVITPHEPIVQVDGIEVAQFIYVVNEQQENQDRDRNDHIKSCSHPWSLYAGAQGSARRYSR